MSPRLLAEGTGFAEGPLPLPDGRIVFCDGTHGTLLVWAEGEPLTTFARPGGGPNGTLLDADGAILVAQFGSWADGAAPCAPGLQRVFNGTVETLRLGSLVAPNDVVFGPDGAVWLTDSGDHDHLRPTGSGRVCSVREGRARVELDLGPVFPNGIGFTAAGELLWSETTTRRVRILREGEPRTICTLPEGSAPDGLAVGADGRIFVATTSSGGVTVLGPDGSLLDHLAVGPWPTSCRFRGTELVVTAVHDLSGEPGTGSLWLLEAGVSGVVFPPGVRTLSRSATEPASVDDEHAAVDVGGAG